MILRSVPSRRADQRMLGAQPPLRPEAGARLCWETRPQIPPSSHMHTFHTGADYVLFLSRGLNLISARHGQLASAGTPRTPPFTKETRADTERTWRDTRGGSKDRLCAARMRPALLAGRGGEREVLGPAPLLRVSLSTRETGDPRWHSCADSGRRLTPQCAVALSYLFWCLGRRPGYFGMGHGAVGIPAG